MNKRILIFAVIGIVVFGRFGRYISADGSFAVDWRSVVQGALLGAIAGKLTEGVDFEELAQSIADRVEDVISDVVDGAKGAAEEIAG